MLDRLDKLTAWIPSSSSGLLVFASCNKCPSSYQFTESPSKAQNKKKDVRQDVRQDVCQLRNHSVTVLSTKTLRTVRYEVKGHTLALGHSDAKST